jgi:hypothetical protein
MDLANSTCWYQPCGDHSQEPGIGIPRRNHPAAHSTLRHAAKEPSLHRHHQRQEAGCAPWPEEGGCHRGAQCFWAAAVVKVERMAGIEKIVGCTSGSALVKTVLSDARHKAARPRNGSRKAATPTVLRQFCDSAKARLQACVDFDDKRQFLLGHVGRVVFNRYDVSTSLTSGGNCATSYMRGT